MFITLGGCLKTLSLVENMAPRSRYSVRSMAILGLFDCFLGEIRRDPISHALDRIEREIPRLPLPR